MTLPIDHDIPLPEPRSRMRYPFQGLGDSFFIPDGNHNCVSTSMQRARQRGTRFATRRWQQDGNIGLRVWRIA